MAEQLASPAAVVERPIIFSAKMVRAILERRKKQTRRLVRPQSLAVDLLDIYKSGRWSERPLPYGRRGDRLWVRETWYCDDFTAGDHVRACVGCVKCSHTDADRIRQWRENLYYRADAIKTGTICELIPECTCDGQSPWRPSIFMPRWASRITLEVTGVRIERLQDITDEDVRAEGVTANDCTAKDGTARTTWRGGFRGLWDSINSKRGDWKLNPWVFVVEFDVLEVRDGR